MQKVIPLFLLTLAVGCQVPATSIHYDRATGLLDIRSPKDVTIAGITADVGTNGLHRLTVTGYASTNNAAVLSAVALQNAELLKTLADTTTKIINKAP